MSFKKHILNLLYISISVLVMGFSLEWFKHYSTAIDHYSEIALELLVVALSFSIFVITWYAYSNSRDNHALFLGGGFLLMGVLTMYQMLSYPFMPAFITTNSIQKSTTFWSMALVFLAVLSLTSAYVNKNTLPGFLTKPNLFISINIFSIIFLITGLLYQVGFSAFYFSEGSPSDNLIALVAATSVIILYACLLYARKIKENDQYNIIYIIYCFIILIFSNFAYLYSDYSGHLLKATGFYFVYLALYRSSVEMPYEKLTEDEKKLRITAEERYRSLVDNANDAIITTDLDGRIVSWNRSAERLYHLEMREVVGKKLSYLIIPQDKQRENELLIHNILQSKEVFGMETVHQCRSGKKIDVSMTVSPLYNTKRIIIGVSCIIRDITDRKLSEEIQNENMRLGLGIKAKAELLTAMSHDLGTPLNGILGFSTLLKQNIAGELNQKQNKYVDDIIESGYRMLYIIDDILDLGKAETGKIDLFIEKFPVPVTIEETTNLVKEKVSKHNVVLIKEIDPELEFIEADRQRFKQILFNLLSNAVKYSKPEGGSVTIKAVKKGDVAVFSVSDTGIGIKEDDMSKLFKAFEQMNLGLASKYGSTGLGLVITKKLVELHKGEIWAESQYGVGSTFYFTLPIVARNRS
jgi:PAS domain S-box-containing protein